MPAEVLTPPCSFLGRDGCSNAGVPGNRSGNSARMDDGDSNRGAFKFKPQGIREAAHGKLACNIGAVAGWRDDAEDTRQVDNPGVIAGLQQRQEGSGQANDAPEVNIEQPLKVLFAQLLECATKGHSRIVNEEINTLMCSLNGSGESGNRGAIRHVKIVLAYAQPRPVHQGSRFDEPSIIDIGQGKMATAPRQGNGNGAPNT